MNWIESENYEIAEKIRNANKNVIVVPSLNASAPLDSFDVFDGNTNQFIITEIPEKPAREVAVIWNSLLSNGESIENIRKINIAWLTDAKPHCN